MVVREVVPALVLAVELLVVQEVEACPGRRGCRGPPSLLIVVHEVVSRLRCSRRCGGSLALAGAWPCPQVRESRIHTQGLVESGWEQT